MRCRTEDIFAPWPVKISSRLLTGQNVLNQNGHFGSMFNKYHLAHYNCIVQGIAHPIMCNVSKPQLCVSLCETLNTPHQAPSSANPGPLSAKLSLHVTTPGPPFIAIYKTFHHCQRPFYHLFYIPLLAIDINVLHCKKSWLFCIFNLYTKNRHYAQIGLRFEKHELGFGALVH